MLTVSDASKLPDVYSKEIESKTIKWLRFWLSVAVVFVHVPKTETDGFFYVIEFLVSDIISSVAVPMFLIISGYYYFHNVDIFSFQEYISKTKKRFKTLLVPYFLWCLMPIIILSIRKIVGMIIHWHGPNMFFSFWNNINWISVLWNESDGSPMNSPMWFIRNLFILILFTPLLYYLIKKIDYWFLLICGTLNIIEIWIPIVGFSGHYTFWFGLGALIALKKQSVFQVSNRFKWLALLAIPLSVLYYFTPENRWLFLMNICQIPLCFFIAHKIIQQIKININASFYNSSFFIFACHEVFVLELCVSLIHHLVPNDLKFGSCLIFFLSPALCCFFIIFIFLIMNKFTPSLTAILNGGRSQK